ncbi:unnamed protein product, partial [Durusdinium trenchii]
MESTSFLRESYSFALYRWSSLTTRLLFLALDPTPTFLPSKRFGTPLQEAHCNFYLSELLACRTRGLARLQIGARSWDLASLEDGQHLILPSLSEREALMLSPQLRRMNHLKKITVGLKGPTIWVRPLRLAPSRRVRWSQVAHWHLGVVEWTLVAGLLRKAGSDSLWDRWPGCLE